MPGEWYASSWNHSFIRIMDIRCYRITASPSPYRFPSNGFVLATRGKARLIVDGDLLTSELPYLLHAEQHQCMEIVLDDIFMEYYLILYKSKLELPYIGRIGRMRKPPPATVLHFSPPCPPVALQELARRMYEGWQQSSSIARLQVKGLFYQFAHEVIVQHAKRENTTYRPNPMDEFLRYLHEHYDQEIGLEEMAARFNYSSRYLSKLFKRETGLGIIQYLIRYRMERAKQLLLYPKSSVQNIARSVGYADPFYFIRLFKKHVGLSPTDYQKRHRIGVYRTDDCSVMSMFNSESSLYNNVDSENHYQQNQYGERMNVNYRTLPTKAAAVLLALTMILSACGGTGNQGSGSQTSSSSTPPVASNVPAEGSAAASEAQQQAFPRTYVDSTGKSVLIEKQPERIAVGHFAEMEFLFALGVPPVASPLAAEILEEFTVTLGDKAANVEVADLGEVTSPNLEKLLEVNPDLIIGSVGLHEEVYDSLSAIAPVVMLELSGSWDDNLREYATIIGREEAAEAYISELIAEMATANDKLKVFRDESTGFFRLSGKSQFGAIGTSYYSYFFDTEEGLGLTAPESYPEKWEIMQLESLTELNPDHLVLIDYGSSYKANMEEFANSAVWQSLEAVKNNRVYFLDVAATTGGPYAIKHAVKTLLEGFMGDAGQ